jgi:prepilin-type N-terminal cleavage/methylation domain-containing protein
MISTLKKLQAKKAAQENSGGFTLIELLIVIVVLGILAAVVVFSLGGVTGSSVVSACQADGATVETAIASSNAQNVGVVPSAANLVPTYLVSFPSSTHYVFDIDTVGTLWEAKGGVALPSPNTAAQIGTLNTPTVVWTKWIGSATCSSTTTN